MGYMIREPANISVAEPNLHLYQSTAVTLHTFMDERE